MEKNNKEKSMMCDCENCQIPWYQSYHRHFFLRWVLGLIILGLTFAVGFKLGEFKQVFEGLNPDGYGHNLRPMMFFDNGYGMMGTYPVQLPSTSTNTKNTTATTK